jgi:hypothetical protein
VNDPVYLTTSYREMDQVRALGARFDVDRRQWYVPAGRDLAPFERWLPKQGRNTLVTTAVDVVQGVSLTQLMARIGQAVADAFPSGE